MDDDNPHRTWGNLWRVICLALPLRLRMLWDPDAIYDQSFIDRTREAVMLATKMGWRPWESDS